METFGNFSIKLIKSYSTHCTNICDKIMFLILLYYKSTITRTNFSDQFYFVSLFSFWATDLKQPSVILTIKFTKNYFQDMLQ